MARELTYKIIVTVPDSLVKEGEDYFINELLADAALKMTEFPFIERVRTTSHWTGEVTFDTDKIKK